MAQNKTPIVNAVFLIAYPLCIAHENRHFGDDKAQIIGIF